MTDAPAQGAFYSPDTFDDSAAPARRVRPVDVVDGDAPAVPTPGPAGASPRPAKRDAMEVMGSLDGWEEIAVERFFGADALASDSETKVCRMLLFVLERRDGALDDEAYKTAMGARLSDLKAIFGRDDEQPADGRPEA